MIRCACGDPKCDAVIDLDMGGNLFVDMRTQNFIMNRDTRLELVRALLEFEKEGK